MERRPSRHRIDSRRDLETGLHGLASRRSSDRVHDGKPCSTDDGSSEIKQGEAVILIPLFNDWASLAKLLPRGWIQVLAAHFLTVDVLIVDVDGLDGRAGVSRPRGGGVLRLFAGSTCCVSGRNMRAPASNRRWSCLRRRLFRIRGCGRGHGWRTAKMTPRMFPACSNDSRKRAIT